MWLIIIEYLDFLDIYESTSLLDKFLLCTKKCLALISFKSQFYRQPSNNLPAIEAYIFMQSLHQVKLMKYYYNIKMSLELMNKHFEGS